MTASNGNWDLNRSCSTLEDANANRDSDRIASPGPEPPPVISEHNEFSEPVLKRIFSYLDLFDLKMCREVSKSWNEATIQSESFLSTVVLFVSYEAWNSDMISMTQVGWRYIRIKLFDILEYFNGAATHEFPPFSFFAEIKTIEFHQCIVSWNTIKKMVLSCPNIEHLILTRCLFQEGGPVDIDNDLSLAALAQMTQFTISDVADVRGIMACIQKLVIYNATNIESLVVNFNPYFSRVCTEVAAEFCTVLGQLIQKNASTLRTLILNLRSSEILNLFCPIVLSRLEMFYCLMKLRVFHLAPPILGGPNESISYETPRALLMLSEFIGIQPTLKSVAYPNLQNLGSYENRRWQIAEHIPKNAERIRVPGPFYFRRTFLKTFYNITEYFIGEKTCQGPTGLMNPIKYIYDYRTGIVKANCRKVRELSVYAKVNYESGRLYHILEKFPSLTKFELDVFRPLIDDKDLQAIIKYLPMLSHLSLTHCDLITDQGVTGIPLDVCKNLHQLSTIYTESELKPSKLRKDGKPLSDLKGMVTLHLFGKAKLTDVGIKLGLEFNGLQNLHLPLCDRISEWGMVHLGKQNPSLRVLVLSGATPSTVVGCTQLVNEHSRLLKQNCRIMSVNEQLDDEFANPSLLTAILWGN